MRIDLLVLSLVCISSGAYFIGISETATIIAHPEFGVLAVLTLFSGAYLLGSELGWLFKQTAPISKGDVAPKVKP